MPIMSKGRDFFIGKTAKLVAYHLMRFVETGIGFEHAGFSH